MKYSALLLAVFAPMASAAPVCVPPAPFEPIQRCAWECPDYRKGSRPQNLGPLKHTARCSPQAGHVASFFSGTLSLSGRVEKVETTTWGEILVFFPDAQSAPSLPEPRHGGELWFANRKAAEKMLTAPRLVANKKTCWAAPARIVVSGLLTDLGDHYRNHDWVALQSVVEVGPYKGYGCELH